MATRLFVSFVNQLKQANWNSQTAKDQALMHLKLVRSKPLGESKDKLFIHKLSEKLVKKLLPALLREVFPNNAQCLKVATRCEFEGTYQAAEVAVTAAFIHSRVGNALVALQAAEDITSVAAAYVPYNDRAIYIVKAAVHANLAADKDDKYLKMVTDLAVEVLLDLATS